MALFLDHLFLARLASRLKCLVNAKSSLTMYQNELSTFTEFGKKPTRIIQILNLAGIDKILDETVQFDSSVNNMLILDDVMHEVAKKKKAATLFTRDMHHKNVSVWFILQNLYKQGPSMRDIVLNCQLL